MFDPNCQMYPPDVECELVSLIVVPRFLRCDCEGFLEVLGVDVASHFLVPLDGSLCGIGTCTWKGWLVEVGVTVSHSFVHWFTRLN
jgi:hypothetical protein